MKIENRQDSVFMAHNGMSIFFNKRSNSRDGSWINVNVTVKGEGEMWHNIGDMDVRLSDITVLLLKLEELAK